MFIENYLAGDKIVVDPFVVGKPCVDQSIEPRESEISILYPACAATRILRR